MQPSEVMRSKTINHWNSRRMEWSLAKQANWINHRHYLSIPFITYFLVVLLGYWVLERSNCVGGWSHDRLRNNSAQAKPLGTYANSSLLSTNANPSASSTMAFFAMVQSRNI